MPKQTASSSVPAKKAVTKAKPKAGPKVTVAKGPVTWKNKTVAEFEDGENVKWVAQLSLSSDGRKYRSIKQVITKRDGTQHFINGMAFKNESSGRQIKGIIRLLKTLLPKGE